MTLHLKGTVQRLGMGSGTWVLTTADGNYELHADTPPAILQAGLHVSVSGIIREDIMTLAMVGPVLEVESFETP